MENFANWSMLLDWLTFTTIVLGITQFTKDLPKIKGIPTKYWSFIIALILMVVSNFEADTFRFIDIVLYIISSMFASMAANGIYDAGTKKIKTE